MIIVDGKEYRNLEEQVQYLSEKIEGATSGGVGIDKLTKVEDVGEPTVTYDTTDGITIETTDRYTYKAGNLTAFNDVPTTKEIPIFPGKNITIDANPNGTGVIISSNGGGGTGGGIEDVKVDGVSVVSGDVANIDLTPYAKTTFVEGYHDATKQDKLTAGTGIKIENNVISATGGGGGTAGVSSIGGVDGEIVLGDNLHIDGQVLSATNTVTTIAGVSGTIELGTGLSMEGVTLSATAQGGGEAVTLNAASTATNGTLTAEQLAKLQANDLNYIIFNNEFYYLGDKGYQEGYLGYTHNGYENSTGWQKTITINISTRAWVLTVTEIGGGGGTGGAVNSVNGKTGTVVLSASDVGAVEKKTTEYLPSGASSGSIKPNWQVYSHSLESTEGTTYKDTMLDVVQTYEEAVELQKTTGRYAVPLYDAAGTLDVGNPVSSSSAVNKGYVDKAVSANIVDTIKGGEGEYSEIFNIDSGTYIATGVTSPTLIASMDRIAYGMGNTSDTGAYNSTAYLHSNYTAEEYTYPDLPSDFNATKYASQLGKKWATGNMIRIYRTPFIFLVKGTWTDTVVNNDWKGHTMRFTNISDTTKTFDSVITDVSEQYTTYAGSSMDCRVIKLEKMVIASQVDFKERAAEEYGYTSAGFGNVNKFWDDAGMPAVPWYNLVNVARGSNKPINRASGDYSHAEGEQTVATANSQHVEGKYNIIDTAKKYLHIAGNGTSTTRSNAYTLDWSGNGVYSGKVTVGSEPSQSKDLTTKNYVDTQVGKKQDKLTAGEGITITNNVISATGGGGTAATITVGTTTTGEPGTEASVTNSGTSTDAVFNFVIPRGADGPKGETGADGAIGPQGPIGETGATGPAAGFGTPRATINNTVGTPSVTVTASGPDTAKVFEFNFSNLKGDPGDSGASVQKYLHIITTSPRNGLSIMFIDQSNTQYGSFEMMDYLRNNNYTTSNTLYTFIRGQLVDSANNQVVVVTGVYANGENLEILGITPSEQNEHQITDVGWNAYTQAIDTIIPL